MPKGVSFGLCDFAFWFTLVCRILIYLSEEGNGNPLQYSCLGNPINREAWHQGALDLDSAPSFNNFPDGSVVKNLPAMQET